MVKCHAVYVCCHVFVDLPYPLLLVLQMFRVLFNATFPWAIDRDLW